MVRDDSSLKSRKMSEVEKLDAGLEYDFHDPEVNARKLHAIAGCRELNAVDPADPRAMEEAVRNLFGSVGAAPTVLARFSCDNGRNIHVGDDFLANYNVTILDIAPVRIGDHVMIGPGSSIITVNHPLSPAGRRRHLGQAKPVTIGDDVWIGANCTILPGVTLGDNVVVAAGAVVTKDVPSNTVVGGVPAGDQDDSRRRGALRAAAGRYVGWCGMPQAVDTAIGRGNSLTRGAPWGRGPCMGDGKARNGAVFERAYFMGTPLKYPS
ncbi:MAG: sugar O-acetyltransferase [Bifidobacterium sp.]|nr:sugar O-acetyltransferase [Bifidobacterium sp.]